MSKISEQVLRARLQWVEYARVGILSAIEDKVNPTFQVFPTVDPLKVILKITVSRPLAKSTRSYFRTYIRCWASEFGCDVPIINIEDRHIQAEVLIVSRHWSRDATGKFKVHDRFNRGS
jgi:hypothetical protein